MFTRLGEQSGRGASSKNSDESVRWMLSWLSIDECGSTVLMAAKLVVWGVVEVGGSMSKKNEGSGPVKSKPSRPANVNCCCP